MKWLNILILIVVVLIIRLSLPYAILHYAEYRINQIPDYQVSIDDVSLQLYRGSCTFYNIQLNKRNANIPVPFFSASSISLAVDWPALLKGHLAAELILNQPVLNLVTDTKKQAEELTIDQQWQTAVNGLIPFKINRILIKDGSLHFRSYTAKPPFDIYLQHINASLGNIRGVSSPQQPLPTLFNLQAEAMTGAPVLINAALDLTASQPTFKVEASLKRLNVRQLNHFLKQYTKVEFQRGWFNLYLEAAAKQGKINGYIKPFVSDLQISNPEQKNQTVVKKIYKSALQTVNNLLKNSDTQAIATRITIQGQIADPNTSVWIVITNLLRNAFLQALLPQLDHNIDMGTVDDGGYFKRQN